jgi:hypothetical protein
MTEDEMVFDDISLKVIPVTLGKDSYVLREATGEVACGYRSVLLSKTKYDAEGKPQITINTEVETWLVAHSLFENDGDKDEPVVGKAVTSEFVDDLPNRVIKPLYAKIKEISDLDEKEPAKGNSQTPNAEQGTTQDG